MEYPLIIFGFILVFGLFIWYAIDMKKIYKEEQDYFEKARHLPEKDKQDD